jgi:DNA mismatch repair ATPase MutL
MALEAAWDDADALSEDDDVVWVDEQEQQPQQERGASGRVAGSGEQQQQQQRPPLVVDYSMSQLLADVDLQMQQLRVQQQQQRDVRGSSHLAAASLQGMAAADGPDPPSTSAAAAAAADGSGPPDAATSELMRVFNKASFGQMRAVGQFNLGFIIARLQGDLFIVDQHAAGVCVKEHECIPVTKADIPKPNDGGTHAGGMKDDIRGRCLC